MKYNVTWQQPTPPDIYYHLHVESDAGTANLMLTVPEVIAAFKAIRDDEYYHPYAGCPWWVEAEHGRSTFTIEAMERYSSLCLRFPGEQVHAALEEILEHASQQGDDEA